MTHMQASLTVGLMNFKTLNQLSLTITVWLFMVSLEKWEGKHLKSTDLKSNNYLAERLFRYNSVQQTQGIK